MQPQIASWAPQLACGGRCGRSRGAPGGKDPRPPPPCIRSLSVTCKQGRHCHHSHVVDGMISLPGHTGPTCTRCLFSSWSSPCSLETSRSPTSPMLHLSLQTCSGRCAQTFDERDKKRCDEHAGSFLGAWWRQRQPGGGPATRTCYVTYDYRKMVPCCTRHGRPGARRNATPHTALF